MFQNDVAMKINEHVHLIFMTQWPCIIIPLILIKVSFDPLICGRVWSSYIHGRDDNEMTNDTSNKMKIILLCLYACTPVIVSLSRKQYSQTNTSFFYTCAM